MSATKAHYAEVFRRFQAPLSKVHDCGKKCAPLNNGQPVCCDIEHAVPLVDKGEWALLKSRTKMWTPVKPKNSTERRNIKEMEGENSCAVVCRGAAHCERDNRSLACRAFPFFPYFNREGELVGLSHYWVFEGLCWIIANPVVVEKKFITEMIAAHEYLFKHDEDWRKTFIEYSGTMRRAFSRMKRKLPVLGRDGGHYWVLPKSGGKMVEATGKELLALRKLFPSDQTGTAA